MNMYDTKIISCVKCGKGIGEVEYDAEVMQSKCGKCANPLPEGDNIWYTVHHYQNIPRKQVLQDIKC